MKRIHGVGVAVVPRKYRQQQEQLPLVSSDAAATLLGKDEVDRLASRGLSLVQADGPTFERGLQIGSTRITVRRLYQTDRGQALTVGSLVYVKLHPGQTLPFVDGLRALGNLSFAPEFVECVVSPDVDVFQLLDVLRNDERVAYAEADLALVARSREDLPAEALQVWPFEEMHVGAAWSVTKGDSVRVAVIDTGFDVEHPDLATQVDRAAAAFVGDGGDGKGVITIGDLETLQRQDTSHGTYCAALVAGALNDRFGCGVAPNATLVPIAVNEQISQPGLSRAIAYAVKPSAELAGLDDASRCDIISCSLGFEAAQVNELLAAALNFAEENGVVVCWAVPNEPGPVDPICRHPTVMGIGATLRDGGRRPGATGDGLFCVAPGDSVASAVPDGNLFEEKSGTSVATPIVAGVCALARSAARKQGVELSPESVRRVIESACDGASPAGDFGHGRVDAGAAVQTVIASLT